LLDDARKIVMRGEDKEDKGGGMKFVERGHYADPDVAARSWSWCRTATAAQGREEVSSCQMNRIRGMRLRARLVSPVVSATKWLLRPEPLRSKLLP
jgi:hypothetical protein